MKLTQSEIHAALRQLIDKIEACGASTELTAAVVLAGDIKDAVGNEHNPASPFSANRVRVALGLPEVSTDSRTPLERANGLLAIQGSHGNWNCDSYMHGMFNGMELVIATIEERDTVFRDKPAEGFLSDRKKIPSPAPCSQAIAELEIALETAETNGPIHRNKGNFGQAELCAARATSLREAIATLKFAEVAGGDTDSIASYLYSAYSAGVGGVAYNGDKLPTWDEFATDPNKQKQADAWRYVANCVRPIVRPSRTTFKQDLALVLNCHSKDAELKTSDFVLAEFLDGCLAKRKSNPMSDFVNDIAPPSEAEVQRVVQWMLDLSRHVYPVDNPATPAHPPA